MEQDKDKEKIYEITLRMNEPTYNWLKSKYEDYCDVMEIRNESFEYYLGTCLCLYHDPISEEIENKKKDRIVEIVRKNPGITPAQVHEKLSEMEKKEKK